jgi:hypothetical protein
VELTVAQVDELREPIYCADVPATVGTRARIVLWFAENRPKKEVAEAPEDRRAWESDLLHRYLDMVTMAGGPAVGFAEAWRPYRQSLFSAMAWWTGTLGLPDAYGKATADTGDLIQPCEAQIALIGRMATAIDDLDALASIAET